MAVETRVRFSVESILPEVGPTPATGGAALRSYAPVLALWRAALVLRPLPGVTLRLVATLPHHKPLFGDIIFDGLPMRRVPDSAHPIIQGAPSTTPLGT